MLQNDRVYERAAAKLNLSLRVLGRRSDGYHLLESLVMFTQNVADELVCDKRKNDKAITLEMNGLYADKLVASCPDPQRNLVMRAAHLLQETYKVSSGAHIMLTKNIPFEAGLGGGSSDAAATLRALNQLWGIHASLEELAKLGAVLGADVPMCVYNCALIARGVGEEITVLPMASELYVVIVMPALQLSTPEVFKALQWKQGDGVLPNLQSNLKVNTLNIKCLVNDLYAPACQLVPSLKDVVETLLSLDGVVCARMTGSGSACFAVVDSYDNAAILAKHVQKNHGNWWVRAGTLS